METDGPLFPHCHRVDILGIVRLPGVICIVQDNQLLCDDLNGIMRLLFSVTENVTPRIMSLTEV